MIIVSRTFFRIFTRNFARAMALFPFIIVKDKLSKEDKVILNHEKIHLKQQRELLIIPFYVLYLLEFIVRFIVYRDFNRAYHNISFEREAFENDENQNYLDKRKFWSFVRYYSNQQRI